MRPRRPVADGELPPKRYWPKLPPELQEAILLFLLGYLDEADAAKHRAQLTVDLHPEEIFTRGQLAYWSNVVSGIKWLIYRVDKRQKYLAILKHAKDPEPCPANSGPAPSSAAEQSGPVSEHGTRPGESPTAGPTPARSSPSSSPKAGTTRAKRSSASPKRPA